MPHFPEIHGSRVNHEYSGKFMVYSWSTHGVIRGIDVAKCKNDKTMKKPELFKYIN